MDYPESLPNESISMETRYELVMHDTIERFGRKLYRIQAAVDMPLHQIHKGDLGGWIESPDNLPQLGNGWVDEYALVYGNAIVTGDALVTGHAEVFGHALIHDRAVVRGHARVFANAEVAGDATIADYAMLGGSARIAGIAELSSYDFIGGDTVIDSARYALLEDDFIEMDGATLYRVQALIDNPFHGVTAGDKGGYIQNLENLAMNGSAWVADDALVYGQAHVSENALISGSARVSGNAQVSGSAIVTDKAVVCGSAKISGFTLIDGQSVRDGSRFRLLKDQSIEIGSGSSKATLYRIQATMDNPLHHVRDGDLGGWVENESNLAVLSEAWIADEAKVWGRARVGGKALVSGHAEISGNALVYDNARVRDHARISGMASVFGLAEVGGTTTVDGMTQLSKRPGQE